MIDYKNNYCIAGLTLILWAHQLNMRLLPLVLETISLTSSWHVPNSPAQYCLSNLTHSFPNKAVTYFNSSRTHYCHNIHDYHTSPHLHIWPRTRVRALQLPVWPWTQDLVAACCPAPTEDMPTFSAKTVARYYCSLGYRVRKVHVWKCIRSAKGSFVINLYVLLVSAQHCRHTHGLVTCTAIQFHTQC